MQEIQSTDYYPFGLAHSTNNLNKNKYLFSGEELQGGTLGGSMLGLYYFGARHYNPLLERWLSQDPMRQFLSPYRHFHYIERDAQQFIAFYQKVSTGQTIFSYLYQTYKSSEYQNMYIGGILLYAMGVFYLWVYKNLINIFRSRSKRKYIHYEELWKNEKAQDSVDNISYELLCKLLGGIISACLLFGLNYLILM